MEKNLAFDLKENRINLENIRKDLFFLFNSILIDTTNLPSEKRYSYWFSIFGTYSYKAYCPLNQ